MSSLAINHDKTVMNREELNKIATDGDADHVFVAPAAEFLGGQNGRNTWLNYIPWMACRGIIILDPRSQWAGSYKFGAVIVNV